MKWELNNFERGGLQMLKRQVAKACGDPIATSRPRALFEPTDTFLGLSKSHCARYFAKTPRWHPLSVHSSDSVKALDNTLSVRLPGKAVLEWMSCSITSDVLAMPNGLLVLHHPNVALSPKVASARKPLVLEVVRTIANVGFIRPGY